MVVAVFQAVTQRRKRQNIGFKTDQLIELGELVLTAKVIVEVC